VGLSEDITAIDGNGREEDKDGDEKSDKCDGEKYE
jgi:hypothetical protein